MDLVWEILKHSGASHRAFFCIDIFDHRILEFVQFLEAINDNIQYLTLKSITPIGFSGTTSTSRERPEIPPGESKAMTLAMNFFRISLVFSMFPNFLHLFRKSFFGVMDDILEFGQDWLEGRNNNVHNLAFNGVAPGPFFHPLAGMDFLKAVNDLVHYLTLEGVTPSTFFHLLTVRNHGSGNPADCHYDQSGHKNQLHFSSSGFSMGREKILSVANSSVESSPS